MLALLLAREALRTRPSPASRSRLHEALFRVLERTILRGHQRAVSGAVFAPAGDAILTWSEDGSVRLWREGREVARFQGDDGEATAAAFSIDGSRVAAGFEGGSVRIPLPRPMQPRERARFQPECRELRRR